MANSEQRAKGEQRIANSGLLANGEQRIANSFLRKLSNLLLYSSLWISACAASLVTFTYDVTGSGILLDPLVGFVFCGTLVIYSVHRLAGIELVKNLGYQGRFDVIRKYQRHIQIYGVAALLGGIYFLMYLPFHLILWLFLPAFLSFMYVVPLGKRKRWRDYPLVKIFLISGVWAALTGLIPFIHADAEANALSGTILFFERAFFIFAITIPFDIRDVNVDDRSGLKTLPQLWGVKRSKWIALLILLTSAIFTAVLIMMRVYDQRLILPYAIAMLITGALIWNSRTELDDHYYSGLLDGTMFLIPFVYWVATTATL